MINCILIETAADNNCRVTPRQAIFQRATVFAWSRPKGGAHSLDAGRVGGRQRPGVGRVAMATLTETFDTW